jgi:hypothetical protein
MPYYPQTKIQTNLFSNGELIRSSDFTSYVGPYYKLSTGDRFVGQNPQVLRYPELLIDLKDFQQPTDSQLTKQAPNFSTLTELGNYTQNLKEQYVSRKVPIPYYPQPTQQDYQIGYFTRYFAKQANDTTFIEINQSTFENLSQHNSEYLWELYNVTSFPWQINGNVENVFKTNRNIVRLEEKNSFIGLSRFLKENYIKFYQGADQNKDLSLLIRDKDSNYNTPDNHIDIPNSTKFGDMK